MYSARFESNRERSDRPRRGYWLGPMLAALTLAGAPGLASGEPMEIRIGGTGGALGTMRLLADGYRKLHPEARITVLPSLGSGGGIKAVLAGAIHVAVSARPLAAAEVSEGANGAELGRTPFVFAVSKDTKIDAITTGDLVNIYSGVQVHWPDGSKVRIVLRPAGDTDSELMKSVSPEVRKAIASAQKRPGMLFAVTDQDAAENLENIPGAFGPTTLAQIIAERRGLKALRLNGVEPKVTTLVNGSYPYSKPLFIVTGPKCPLPVLQFVDFVRSAEGRGILARNGITLNY